jgi:hypothetical protein
VEALSFSFAFFTIDIYFKGGEKEGAGRVLKVRVNTLSILFALMQKEPKKSRRNRPDSHRDRRFRRAHAHEQSL